MRAMMRSAILGTMVVGLGAGAAAWAAAPVPGAGGQAPGYLSAAGAGMAPKSQGYLGVDIRDVGDEQIAALKLKESRGAEVTRVDHDGPAGKAGLREHDVILQMNGQVIEGEDQLRRMLRETPAGRTVTLIISRDGQQQTVTTQLANRLEVERQAWEQRWRVPVPYDESLGFGPGPAVAPPPAGTGSGSGSSGGGSGSKNFFSGSTGRSGHNLMGVLTGGSSYTGAMVETMGPQLAEFFGTNGAGVLVHSVDANSPAANAGLRAGDVVVRANEMTLTSSGDWLKVVRENRGKPVQVVVLRDKKEQTLTLVPDGKKRSNAEPLPKGDGRTEMIVAATRVGYSFR
jgi:serine protease Do